MDSLPSVALGRVGQVRFVPFNLRDPPMRVGTIGRGRCSLASMMLARGVLRGARQPFRVIDAERRELGVFLHTWDLQDWVDTVPLEEEWRKSWMQRRIVE